MKPKHMIRTWKIRAGDLVQVVSGDDKGSTGARTSKLELFCFDFRVLWPRKGIKRSYFLTGAKKTTLSLSLFFTDLISLQEERS